MVEEGAEGRNLGVCDEPDNKEFKRKGTGLEKNRKRAGEEP